jgi:hypothetical protein
MYLARRAASGGGGGGAEESERESWWWAPREEINPRRWARSCALSDHGPHEQGRDAWNGSAAHGPILLGLFSFPSPGPMLNAYLHVSLFYGYLQQNSAKNPSIQLII